MNRFRDYVVDVAVITVGVCAGASLVACGGSRCIGGDGFSCEGPPPSSDDAAAPDAPAPSVPDAAADGPQFPDVSIPDADSCHTLNIGIFGTLGNTTTSNFLQWLKNAGTSVTQLQTNSTDPAIDANTLAPFDVVLLSKLARPYTPAEASALKDRVATGGGLVSLTGFMLDWYSPSYTNDLLAPFSLAYGGNLFDGPITSFATHPMTVGLTSVSFVGGYTISDLGANGSTRTAIAFQPGSSSPVGYAVELGLGRGFVWGDEWIEYDSEWTTNAEIKQLWVNVFHWVAPKGCAIQPP